MIPLPIGFALSFLAPSGDPPPIPVVVQRMKPEYEAIARAFADELGRPTELVVYGQTREGLENLLARAAREKPPLVVAIGGTALADLNGRMPVGTALVFAGVLRPDLVLRGSAVPGVSLDIPLAWKVRETAAKFPGLKRFGLVYDPEAGAGEVEEARAAARDSGLSLDARPARADGEALAAWRDLFSKTDAILLHAPCNALRSREIFDELRRLSLSHRVPLVGLTPAHVERNALLAYTPKYGEHGRQAARLANRLLSGEKGLGVEGTTAIDYVLREDAVHLFRLPVPAETASKAGRVVGER